VHVSLGYINSHDGSSDTLMIAENASSVPPIYSYSEEGRWAPIFPYYKTGNTDTSVVDGGSGTYYQGLHNATVLGFNWADMNPLDPNTIVNKQTPDQKIYANHPGGVVVSMCDGHQYFLRTDIETVIYMQLMCPSDRDVYTASGYGICDPLNPNDPSKYPVPPLDESKY